jgi:hypothetical protein
MAEEITWPRSRMSTGDLRGAPTACRFRPFCDYTLLRGVDTSRTALMICLHDMRTVTCHKSAYLSANLHLLSFDIDRFPSTLSSLSVSLLLFFILVPQLADVVVVYLVSSFTLD